MNTIECPVCGMTYTGKQCPICGAKVKIRYRDRSQAQAQAQAQPAPEPIAYEDPQPTVTTAPSAQQRQGKRTPNRAAFGIMMAIMVIFASSFAGFLGVSNSARRSYEDSQYVYEYTAYPGMTDYEIEPQVIYDANGVKVVIEHFRTNDYMTEVHLHFYNDNDYAVRVSSELATIDGVASEEWIYTMVEAQSEAEDAIYIFDSNLEEKGLQAVHELAFQLHLRDEDTYADLDRSERIVFKTPIEGAVQHTAPEGDVVYEKDGIRVKQIETRIEEDRFVIRYYVENHSDKDITVYGDELIVNGEEGTSSYVYGPEIPAGDVGYVDAVVYDYSDMVEDVSGTVFLKEYDTWNDIGQFDLGYGHE